MASPVLQLRLVVEADGEDEIRAHAAKDPVVTTGTGTIEVGTMLAGFVRP